MKMVGYIIKLTSENPTNVVYYIHIYINIYTVYTFLIDISMNVTFGVHSFLDSCTRYSLLRLRYNLHTIPIYPHEIITTNS